MRAVCCAENLACCESGRDDEVAPGRKGRTHLMLGAILSLSQRTATALLLLRRGESEASSLHVQGRRRERVCDCEQGRKPRPNLNARGRS